jgi:spermidine synthase
MTPFIRFILFQLFLVSGFCGLLYQVVWLRMAFASFGVVTSVLSVVVSVFMLGLFIGSWAAGRVVDPLTRRTGLSAIHFYALSEGLIAIGAWGVPRLFAWGEELLLVAGERDSYAYLAWSGLIVAGAILPWCICMGATFPLMTAFVKEQEESSETGFSFLYLANVIGAMLGTLLSAMVLIELLGFRRTLWVAAACNLLIGLVAFAVGIAHPRAPRAAVPGREGEAPSPVVFSREFPATASRWRAPVPLILFVTGFTSMAMEVVWTREFTPVLKTQVYSFAALLFVYLLATWMGSFVYREHLLSHRTWSAATLIALLASAALVPLVVNDPHFGSHWLVPLASIFPFCFLLGYLTPKLIDEYSHGRPDRVGSSYAINILGCILGPLAASYLLLPAMGLKYVLFVLAAPYALLLLWSALAGELSLDAQLGFGASAALLFVVSFVRIKAFDDPSLSNLVLRDNTATVTCSGTARDKRLEVNGVGMTALTQMTKVMAHLTLASLDQPPKSTLVICFGMGTTWRSAMSWDISVTAAELVPSVRAAFPYFYDDAVDLLARPNGKIVVDDGRRFLCRTTETFDAIIIDPPPPIQAAGSSLLYSEEFYEAAKLRLAPHGILQQWIPTPCERVTAQAMARAILRSFPHVRMLANIDGGVHVLASRVPIPRVSVEQLVAKLPPAAVSDLIEWLPEDKSDPGKCLRPIVRREFDPKSFAGDGAECMIDDQPFNEYFLLRRFGDFLNRVETSEARKQPPRRARKSRRCRTLPCSAATGRSIPLDVRFRRLVPQNGVPTREVPLDAEPLDHEHGLGAQPPAERLVTDRAVD